MLITGCQSRPCEPVRSAPITDCSLPSDMARGLCSRRRARCTATRTGIRKSEDYVGHVNPIGPRSVYDEAKRFAEAMTFAYSRRRGVRVGVARIFNTYGPRMQPDDGRIVPNFITQALAD
jgi:nucleoside-diphosphate-sugar epimerase